MITIQSQVYRILSGEYIVVNGLNTVTYMLLLVPLKTLEHCKKNEVFH